MSESVEKIFIPLVNNDNNLVGIHRVKYSTTSVNIEDILLNGLKMIGHLGGIADMEAELRDH